MSKINYVQGDATSPQANGMKIIPHICNDIGAWGAGFVMAISNKWSKPEEAYRGMSSYILGDVQFVMVEPDLIIANIIGQHDIGIKPNGEIPLRYDAVKQGLLSVNEFAKGLNATVHMPRIGCGLAGGDWNKIEEIIKDVVEVDTTVYDFN